MPSYQRTLVLSVTFCIASVFTASPPQAQAALPDSCRHRIIDVHSQVDFADFEAVIRSLNRSCVAAAFLSGRRWIKPQQIIKAARRWPGRILPMLKTKNKFWTKKSPKFSPLLERGLGSGRFFSAGELLVLHQQKGRPDGRRWAPRIAYPPDGPWVLRAVDVIASQGFPVHYHLEAGLEPDVIPAFERFLRKRPKVRVILGHRGHLEAGELGRLLRAHPNLYTHMGQTALQRFRKAHFSGYGEVFEGGRLKAEWASLMNEMPDRFLYAQDNVWEFQWPMAPEAAALWRKNFRYLKPETLRLFTHGNAERLFRIPASVK